MIELIDAELQALIKKLQHEDAAVRRVAVLDIADFAEPAALPAFFAEPAALPALIAALQDADASVRAQTARVLEGWDDLAVVTALVAALADADADTAHAAAESLAQLKSPAVAAPLLHGLEQADSAFVRASLLRALRELRVVDAAKPASQLLLYADSAVRREAVAVLGWLKWQPALPALAERLLQDDEVEVRRAAAGALGFARNEVVDALIQALADSAWQVREEAVTTLAKVLLGSGDAALLERGGAAIVAALNDDYWQVRPRSAQRRADSLFASTHGINSAVGSQHQQFAQGGGAGTG